MAAPEPAAPRGFLDALKGVGEGLLGTVHDRLQLISLELHEEKSRLIQTFIWICAAVFTGMLALTFASLTLVYFFWETARLAVLGGLAVFYLTALGAIIAAFRHHLAHQPRPFEATLRELQEDRTCIRTES